MMSVISNFTEVLDSGKYHRHRTCLFTEDLLNVHTKLPPQD